MQSMLHPEADEPERVSVLGFIGVISKDLMAVHDDLLMFRMLEAKLYHSIIESRQVSSVRGTEYT